MDKILVYRLGILWLLIMGLAGCKKEEVGFISLNKSELIIHPKETFQYQVKSQTMSEEVIYTEEIVWTIEDRFPLGNEGEVVRIDEKGMLTAVSPGQALVKAVLESGEVAIGSVMVNAWPAPGTSGLVLSKSDIYMPLTQTIPDSVALKVDETILERFDLEVTSSNPEAIAPVLVPPTEAELAAGNKEYKVALNRGNSLKDEDVEIRVSAGESSVSCIVHLGMRLYLSFAEVDLTDGINPNLVSTSTNTVGLTSESTIQVYYKLVPDDKAHLEEMKKCIRVTTEGDAVVNVTKYEFKDECIYVYIKSGILTGSVDVRIEGLGVRATAEYNVIDFDKIVVESVTFDANAIEKMIGNKQLETSEVGFNLFDYVSVKPITAAVYWPLKWESSDAQIAKVTSEGLVSIKKAGTFTITATCKDKSASVTFRSKLKLENITIPNTVTTQLVEGESVHWIASLSAKSDYSTEEIALKWTSSNESVAKIDAKGNIKGELPGEALITVEAIDDYGTRVQAKKSITVKSGDDIAIKDLLFNSHTHVYVSDVASEGLLSGSLLTVMNIDTEEIYEFSLFTRDGKELSWNKAASYAWNTDFTRDSYIRYPSGEKATIAGGTISVTANGTLTFDLKATKVSKSVTIKGTVVPTD